MCILMTVLSIKILHAKYRVILHTLSIAAIAHSSPMTDRGQKGVYRVGSSEFEESSAQGGHFAHEPNRRRSLSVK